MHVGSSSSGWLSIAPASGLQAELRYRMWGECGPLVILLHELGGAMWSWERIAPGIAKAGFRVVAVDQRGSGASEKTSTSYAMEVFADDLAEMCRILSPDAPVLFGGLAMGAVTGLHFACRYPDLAAGLALVSPAATLRERARQYLLARAALVESKGMRAAFAASFDNAFPAFCRNDDVTSGYRGQFLANCPSAYAATSRALAEFVDYPRLEDLATPVLLVSGQHDFIWPPEHGAALAKRLRSARLVVTETGHFPPLQAPNVVENLLVDFFCGSRLADTKRILPN
jgi:3-oxoadipate enol-lactonase